MITILSGRGTRPNGVPGWPHSRLLTAAEGRGGGAADEGGRAARAACGGNLRPPPPPPPPPPLLPALPLLLGVGTETAGHLYRYSYIPQFTVQFTVVIAEDCAAEDCVASVCSGVAPRCKTVATPAPGTSSVLRPAPPMPLRDCCAPLASRLSYRAGYVYRLAESSGREDTALMACRVLWPGGYSSDGIHVRHAAVKHLRCARGWQPTTALQKPRRRAGYAVLCRAAPLLAASAAHSDTCGRRAVAAAVRSRASGRRHRRHRRHRHRPARLPAVALSALWEDGADRVELLERARRPEATREQKRDLSCLVTERRAQGGGPSQGFSARWVLEERALGGGCFSWRRV